MASQQVEAEATLSSTSSSATDAQRSLTAQLEPDTAVTSSAPVASDAQSHVMVQSAQELMFPTTTSPTTYAQHEQNMSPTTTSTKNHAQDEQGLPEQEVVLPSTSAAAAAVNKPRPVTPQSAQGSEVPTTPTSAAAVNKTRPATPQSARGSEVPTTPTSPTSPLLSLRSSSLRSKRRAVYVPTSDTNENVLDLYERSQMPSDEEHGDSSPPPSRRQQAVPSIIVQEDETGESSHNQGRPSSVMRKQPGEVAGGMEDWSGVSHQEVDRFGFIQQRQSSSRLGSRNSSAVATTAPGSPDSAARSNRSQLAPVEETPGAANASSDRLGEGSRARQPRISKVPSLTLSMIRRASSVRSGNSRRSVLSTLFRTSSSEVNRGRRWADEAPSMLSNPIDVAAADPGQGDEADGSSVRVAVELKRASKWAKMGQPMPEAGPSPDALPVGGGQIHVFDTKHPKLVSRTWKGIPETWRASAWYSFLLASAQRSPAFAPDAELVAQYHQLQACACEDDAQIELDAPRTITGHVLFRRKNSGGQALLSRVLRALALYFPAIGYAQGMGPLVATLLCYFPEERAFVMAVRMWQHRGVVELFGPDFAGMKRALDAFHGGWLGGVANGAVARTLERHGIDAQTYGAKWYLTLFSYSVPFAAQVRIWDVLMLLGGAEHAAGGEAANFDVLHAVAAGLMDALQEQLIGGEFESAMKLLTTVVPVGEEDILMRMALKEYQLHHRRA